MTSNSMPFDILSYAKKLKQAGFSEEQADVQAGAFSGFYHDQLSVKQDIKELKKDIHSRLAHMETRIIFKLASVNVIVIGLFTGVLGVLIK